jgi:hypothetical protein
VSRGSAEAEELREILRSAGCREYGRMNTTEILRKDTMPETQSKNWRELCSAALGADDPDELLQIVQELNKALKHEEQVRRDFRLAMKATKSSVEIRG